MRDGKPVGSNSNDSFSGIRALLWPIHKHETKRVLCLSLMLFFASFCYNILRNAKDTLVILGRDSSSEVIPFIKVWALLPMAFLFTWIFTKLLCRFDREKIFVFFTLFFISYFMTFAFFVYPNIDYFLLYSVGDFLRGVLPPGMSGFIAMLVNWPTTMYYVMAELWTAIIMGILFWGYANEVIILSEAKRFYGPLNFASSISPFFSGHLAIYISDRAFNPLFMFGGNNAWEQNFIILTTAIFVGSILMLIALRWSMELFADRREASLLDDDNANSLESVAKAKNGKKRPKFGLLQSLEYIRQYRHLFYIALIVISYNLCINLSETVWKAKLHQLYPDANDFNKYLSYHIRLMGLISAFMALLIPTIVNKIGWTALAMVTPISMMITSSLFFGSLLFDNSVIESFAASFGFTSVLSLVVFFGSRNNMLSKASKYSLFDASKEMAYVPLPGDVKISGKACIDGIGSRLGKSGSSFLQQVLFVAFGNVFSAIPWIAAILAVGIFLWLIVTYYLGKSFNSYS